MVTKTDIYLLIALALALTVNVHLIARGLT